MIYYICIPLLEILKDHINYIKLYYELFFFCTAIHYKISFHFVSDIQFKQFHVFINLYEKYRILYYKAYLLVFTLVVKFLIEICIILLSNVYNLLVWNMALYINRQPQSCFSSWVEATMLIWVIHNTLSVFFEMDVLILDCRGEDVIVTC